MAERQRSRKGIDCCLMARAIESEDGSAKSLHVTRLKDNTNKKNHPNTILKPVLGHDTLDQNLDSVFLFDSALKPIVSLNLRNAYTFSFMFAR